MNFSKGIDLMVNEAATNWKAKKASNSKIDVVPVKFVFDLIDELRQRSIVWGVEDFESRARENEGSEAGLDFDDMGIDVPEEFKIYNRSKFDESLLMMIAYHDCNIGITWETIDCYLDRYCK